MLLPRLLIELRRVLSPIDRILPSGEGLQEFLFRIFCDDTMQGIARPGGQVGWAPTTAMIDLSTSEYLVGGAHPMLHRNNRYNLPGFPRRPAAERGIGYAACRSSADSFDG